MADAPDSAYRLDVAVRGWTMVNVLIGVRDGEVWMEGSIDSPPPEPVFNCRSGTATEAEVNALCAEWERRAAILRKVKFDQ